MPCFMVIFENVFDGRVNSLSPSIYGCYLPLYFLGSGDENIFIMLGTVPRASFALFHLILTTSL